MIFDPDQYWRDQGPHLAPPGSSSPEQALVEKEMGILLAELQDINGQVQSVLDVGCGQGRLADFLERELPQAKYSGMDLGEAQIKGTRGVRPDGEFFLARLQDFTPDRQWDLVLASEVLLHIPPDDIEAACRNLLNVTGKYLVTVDWTQPVDGPIAHWNWLHDYDQLLAPDVEIVVGLQSIFLKRM